MLLKTVRRTDIPKLEQPVGFFLLAAWFGLLTGLAEVFLLGIKKFFMHRMLFMSSHFVWLTPVADLLLFIVFGLVLGLAALRWPRLVSLRVAAFVFAFLGSLSLLLMYPRLHRYAQLLLAFGVATQVAYFVAAHPQRFHSIVRRTVGWMVAVVLGLAVGMQGWEWLGYRKALGKLPLLRPGAPNVLLIVLDTVRAQSLSLHGYARATSPQLDRLAKTGVTFERAISTAPWTTPSHASMFTGRFPYELSVSRAKIGEGNVAPLDQTYPTLAEVLGANGYATAGFVANIEYCGYETGLHRGFAYYEDYPLSPMELVLSSSFARTVVNNHNLRWMIRYRDVPSRKKAQDVNKSFLDWLDHRGQQPFFAFLNYWDAHEPYLPPSPFDARFGSEAPRKKFLILPFGVRQAKRHDKEVMTAAEVQVELDAYEGAIAYIDHHLGLLLKELQKRGRLKNTLVIITSDHGEQFGEHKLFGHGNSLYIPLLHVPLVMSFPSRVPAGIRVSEPVSLRDLAATIIDLVGAGEVVNIPGRSLVRHWSGARRSTRAVIDPLLSEVTSSHKAPTRYPVAKGDMKSLVSDRYHYISNGDGSEELYDLEEDRLESYNLVRSSKDVPTVERFRTYLATIFKDRLNGKVGGGGVD